MKKLLAVAAAAVLMLGLAVSFAPQVAVADQNAALVIKDTGCGVLDGNGGIVGAEGRITVVTSSGETTLICKVKGVANPTGAAVVWRPADFPGLLCGTAGGATDDWQNVVSASGNVTLRCSIHHN